MTSSCLELRATATIGFAERNMCDGAEKDADTGKTDKEDDDEEV